MHDIPKEKRQEKLREAKVQLVKAATELFSAILDLDAEHADIRVLNAAKQISAGVEVVVASWRLCLTRMGVDAPQEGLDEFRRNVVRCVRGKLILDDRKRGGR